MLATHKGPPGKLVGRAGLTANTLLGVSALRASPLRGSVQTLQNNAGLMSEKCRKQQQVVRHQLVAGAEIKATILRSKCGLYP